MPSDVHGDEIGAPELSRQVAPRDLRRPLMRDAPRRDNPIIPGPAPAEGASTTAPPERRTP